MTNAEIAAHAGSVCADDASEATMTDDVQDMTLTCADCGAVFVWTAGQQAFFAERNLTRPKRCSTCRQLRRAERERQATERPLLE